jgi:dUTPase
MKQVSKQVKMNVGIKKLHKDAVIPSYAHETDRGEGGYGSTGK